MRKRIEWIDVLRGLAMFFVILGHSFYDKTCIVRKYIYSFHMPLFFFVSGLTYKESDMKFKDFFMKKCKNILLPYAIINLITMIIKTIMYFTLNMYKNLYSINTLKAFFNGIGSDVPCVQSWFLLTLFLAEIIFYLIRKISKNDKITFLIISILAIISFWYSKTSFHTILWWHLDSSFIAVLYYFCGYLFMKNLKKINQITNLKRKWITMVISLLLISIISDMFNDRVSMNSGKYDNILLFITSSVSSIMFYTILLMKLSDIKVDKLLSKIGQFSMFYLAYHSIILSIIKNFWPGILCSIFLAIIISIADVVILCPLAKYTYEKFPILIGKIT